MNNPEFDSYKLNVAGTVKAQQIAEIFDEALTKLINGLVPPGRYQALVRTRMEEASFYAKKGLASALENQQQ